MKKNLSNLAALTTFLFAFDTQAMLVDTKNVHLPTGFGQVVRPLTHKETLATSQNDAALGRVPISNCRIIDPASIEKFLPLVKEFLETLSNTQLISTENRARQKCQEAQEKCEHLFKAFNLKNNDLIKVLQYALNNVTCTEGEVKDCFMREDGWWFSTKEDCKEYINKKEKHELTKSVPRYNTLKEAKKANVERKLLKESEKKEFISSLVQSAKYWLEHSEGKANVIMIIYIAIACKELKICRSDTENAVVNNECILLSSDGETHFPLICPARSIGLSEEFHGNGLAVIHNFRNPTLFHEFGHKFDKELFPSYKHDYAMEAYIFTKQTQRIPLLDELIFGGIDRDIVNSIEKLTISIEKWLREMPDEDKLEFFTNFRKEMKGFFNKRTIDIDHVPNDLLRGNIFDFESDKEIAEKVVDTLLPMAYSAIWSNSKEFSQILGISLINNMIIVNTMSDFDMYVKACIPFRCWHSSPIYISLKIEKTLKRLNNNDSAANKLIAKIVKKFGRIMSSAVYNPSRESISLLFSLHGYDFDEYRRNLNEKHPSLFRCRWVYPFRSLMEALTTTDKMNKAYFLSTETRVVPYASPIDYIRMLNPTI